MSRWLRWLHLPLILLVNANPGGALITIVHSQVAMSFPLLITASGIIVSLFTTFIATDLRPARLVDEIEQTLKYQLIISTVIMTPVSRPSAFCYSLLLSSVRGLRGEGSLHQLHAVGSASDALIMEASSAAY